MPQLPDNVGRPPAGLKENSVGARNACRRLQTIVLTLSLAVAGSKLLPNALVAT
jgi:hypothetical protein